MNTSILNDTTSYNSAWISYAQAKLDLTETPEYVTGESLRNALMDNGLVPPDHHNLWGIFVRELVKAKAIKPIAGALVPSKNEQAHGRKAQLYIRN